MSVRLASKDIAQPGSDVPTDAHPDGCRVAAVTAGFHLIRHVEKALADLRRVSVADPVVHLHGNRAALLKELAGVSSLFGGPSLARKPPLPGQPVCLARNVYLSESSLWTADAPAEATRFYASLVQRGGIVVNVCLLLPDAAGEGEVLEPLRASGGMMARLKIGATLVAFP